MTPQNHHFVLIPLMAQGHMIPMMDVAHLLAERGVKISVITTPVNAARIKTATENLNLPIHLVELSFPCAEVGLPDGCENLHLVPSVSLFSNFFHAARQLAPQLKSFIESQHPRPSCIISDLCLPWTKHVADELNIPRLILNLGCCLFVMCSHIIHKNKLDETMADDMEPFIIPGLPVPIQVTLAQVPGFGGPGSDRDAILKAISTADGILMNSFNELEPWVFEMYQEAIGKKAWGVGPLSLCNKDVATMAARGSSKPDIDANECLRWLDSMKKMSVVFVCFGSTVNTPTPQLIEIGCGLELSGHPFIWVIKKEENSSEFDEWMRGFEARTSKRSLILRGWAPQVAILSHASIGGLMAHSGWNSVVEGVAAGLPMITWPHFADQFVNERLMVEIVEIGVSIGVKAPMGRELLVKRDEIERVVRALMHEGEEGMERREKARVLGIKARKAMEEGGSSYVNVTKIIDFISQLSTRNQAN